MIIPHYAGCTVAVLGLGKTGLTAARALKQGGARVKCWDDNADSRATAEAAGLTCVAPTLEGWSDIVACVWSPGIPHTFPKPHRAKAILDAKGIAPICDIELLLKLHPTAFTIVITGTNGKSTTTALIGHIFKVAGHTVEVGGNLGTPVLDLAPMPFHGTYVLEMSSYQLELTPSLSPDVAVLLNITPDHLARHGGMEGYIAAKELVFRNQSQPATAVIGQEDEHCRAITRRLAATHNATIIPIRTEGEEKPGVFTLDGVLYEASHAFRPERICDLRTMPALPGAHNWQNACAAYAVARSRGLPAATIVEAMRSFPGLAHRQQTVAVIDGVRFVNDSKATNAEAAEKALTCYESVYWIAGGQAKEGGITALKPHFKRIRHAFLIGEAASDFAAVLKAEGVPVTMAGTLEEAVPAAAVRASRDGAPDPVVLLSPACASWDQFKSFEHRGDVFHALVERMNTRGGAAGGGAA